MHNLGESIAGKKTSISESRNATSATPFPHSRRYSPGGVIFSQGEQRNICLQVMQGAVRRCRYSADGTRQVIGFAVAGDVIGLEDSEWDETAEAVTEVLLSPLEKAEGHGRAGGNAALLRRGLGEALQTLAMLGRRTAVERLAAFLLHFADRTGQGATIDLPMSREDIADHLGINMHTASRAFSQLIRCGFIELEGPHCVHMRQPAQLGLLAGQSDCDDMPSGRAHSALIHAGARS